MHAVGQLEVSTQVDDSADAIGDERCLSFRREPAEIVGTHESSPPCTASDQKRKPSQITHVVAGVPDQTPAEMKLGYLVHGAVPGARALRHRFHTSKHSGQKSILAAPFRAQPMLDGRTDTW